MYQEYRFSKQWISSIKDKFCILCLLSTKFNILEMFIVTSYGMFDQYEGKQGTWAGFAFVFLAIRMFQWNC
jgi:hypothetical protein